jgi:hypothetical protein
MKEKITTIAFLILIGCNQNNSNKKENIEFPDSTNTSKEVVIKNDNEKINYNIIEEFNGQDGLYKFKAPKGLFKRSSGDEFTSELLQANIRFTLIRTDRFDEQGIFSKKDLISKYKRKIKTSYFFDKNDWFVLSGNDSESNIIYLKGFYEELESMQGRDEGEPSWLWSKSGVLEIQYTEKNKEEFDKLIPLIIKSFKCDFSLI